MSIKFEDKTDLFLSQLKKAMNEGLNNMGKKAILEIKSNAPFETGALKNSYTYEIEKNKVVVGSMQGFYNGDKGSKLVDYAQYVEFKPVSRGGRPHFRRTLKNVKPKLLEEFKTEMEGIHV